MPPLGTAERKKDRPGEIGEASKDKAEALSPIQEMSNEEWSSPEAEASTPSPISSGKVGGVGGGERRAAGLPMIAAIRKAPGNGNGGGGRHEDFVGRGIAATSGASSTEISPDEPHAILPAASAEVSAMMRQPDRQEQQQHDSNSVLGKRVSNPPKLLLSPILGPTGDDSSDEDSVGSPPILPSGRSGTGAAATGSALLGNISNTSGSNAAAARGDCRGGGGGGGVRGRSNRRCAKGGGKGRSRSSASSGGREGNEGQRRRSRSVGGAGPSTCRRIQPSLPSRSAGVGGQSTVDELLLDATKELSFEFLQYAAVNPSKAARVFLDGRVHSPDVIDKIAEKLSSEPFRLFAEADPKNAAEMLLLVEISASSPGAAPMQQQSEPRMSVAGEGMGAASRTKSNLSASNVGSGNKSEVIAKQGLDQERLLRQQFNASRRVYDEQGRITQPGPYDFVLGKGNGSTDHPGNKFLRAVATLNGPRYRQLQKSRGKSIYKGNHPWVKNLMGVIERKGGDFLEKKGKSHFDIVERPAKFYDTAGRLLRDGGR